VRYPERQGTRITGGSGPPANTMAHKGVTDENFWQYTGTSRIGISQRV
jgi:hypothetical protein